MQENAIIIPEKNILVSSWMQVHDICRILFDRTIITHFHFTKLFSDNTFFTLSNNPHWQRYFFEYCFDPENYPENEEPRIDYILLDSIKPDIAKQASDYFNINNMISVIKRQKNTHIVAGFASQSPSSQLIDYYLNNLDTLKMFVLYFEDAAKDLIKLAENDRLTWNAAAHTSDYLRGAGKLDDLTNLFIPKSITIDYMRGDVNITNSEFKCLFYLSKGFSSKEIGKILSVSYRTIEKHIDNIKRKSNCSTKRQLLDLFKYIFG